MARAVCAATLRKLATLTGSPCRHTTRVPRISLADNSLATISSISSLLYWSDRTTSTPPPADSFAFAISRASSVNLELQLRTRVWPTSNTGPLPCLRLLIFASMDSPINPTSNAKKSMPLSTSTTPTTVEAIESPYSPSPTDMKRHAVHMDERSGSL